MPTTDAPASAGHRPGRHYQLPLHITAAAKVRAERESKRKAGLVTFGGTGVGYDRFGAAFLASGIDAPKAVHDTAPACDASEPPARFSKRGKLELALATVLVTLALAGVGMTVTSTSAPATEAMSAQHNPGSTSYAAPGLAFPLMTSAVSTFEDTVPGNTPPEAVRRQATLNATGDDPSRSTTADPGTGTSSPDSTTGAASTSPDSAESADYPSFSAGTPSATAATGGSTNATGLNDRPAFGGSLSGTSGGAGAGTARFFSAAATPPATTGTSAPAATDTSSASIASPSTPTTGSPTSATPTLGSPTMGDVSGQDGQASPANPAGPPGSSVPTASTPTVDVPSTASPTSAIPVILPGGTAPSAGPLSIADLTVPNSSGTPQPPGLVIPGSTSAFCCTPTQVIAINQQIDVPEPAALALLATGLAATLLGRRRR